LLNFSAKSRLSERTEGDFTLCRNGFRLDHQLIRQLQRGFHMGDDMVLRAGVKGKNPIGHPPAMLGVSFLILRDSGLARPVKITRFPGFQKISPREFRLTR
jgi:hypothetical protein